MDVPTERSLDVDVAVAKASEPISCGAFADTVLSANATLMRRAGAAADSPE